RSVKLDDFQTYAQPLRSLDYLLEDIQPTVLLYEHGIMINVPAPARFAIHKCVVSQKRTAAFAAKSRKDLNQAEQVFQELLALRPGDLSLAYAAAQARGEEFVEDFLTGLGLIDAGVQDSVRKHLR
ncbi:MAG: hypothetical protein IH912_10885, partial [Proteobacteria bacterium]|nr:hypothetical protein [Pseudomonadota bacterium]